MRISDWSSDVCSSDLPLRHTEKLVPQPQPDAALGLVTWKAAPPRDSTKSTALPRTRSRLTSSTTRVTPSWRAVVSPDSTASASQKRYCTPAQAPPSTARRRLGGLPCRLDIAGPRAVAAPGRAGPVVSFLRSGEG